MMRTIELICLRLYCLTLGRFAFGSRLLRRILVRLVVKGGGRDDYAASGGFFDWSELDRDKGKNAP